MLTKDIMAKVSWKIPNYDIGGIEVPVIPNTIFHSHSETNRKPGSTGDNGYGIRKTESVSGSTRKEIEQLDSGVTEIGIYNPDFIEDDPRASHIFAQEMVPLMQRTKNLARAAEKYTEILEAVAEEDERELEELVDEELEKTRAREGDQVIENPQTYMEMTFNHYMVGDESENIDIGYEDAGRYVQFYKDLVMRKLASDHGDEYREKWLEHAA